MNIGLQNDVLILSICIPYCFHLSRMHDGDNSIYIKGNLLMFAQLQIIIESSQIQNICNYIHVYVLCKTS